MAHDVKLGTILQGHEQRDAVHVAIAPVVAVEPLMPGQEIGLIGRFTNNAGRCDTPIGIVDPYLKAHVKKGERFYMWLFPNTITSLRHDWAHPAFGVTSADAVESEAWLREFSDECGLDYEDVMDAAREFLRTGERHTQYGSTDAQEAFYGGGARRFWNHYERVTGQRVDEDDRDSNIFSCSC